MKRCKHEGRTITVTEERKVLGRWVKRVRLMCPACADRHEDRLWNS